MTEVRYCVVRKLSLLREVGGARTTGVSTRFYAVGLGRREPLLPAAVQFEGRAWLGAGGLATAPPMSASWTGDLAKTPNSCAL